MSKDDSIAHIWHKFSKNMSNCKKKIWNEAMQLTVALSRKWKKEGNMQSIREARANYYYHNFIYLRELLPQPKSIQRVSAIRSFGINNVVRWSTSYTKWWYRKWFIRFHQRDGQKIQTWKGSPQSQTTHKSKHKENRIIFFKNRDVKGESIDCRDEKRANPYIP